MMENKEQQLQKGHNRLMDKFDVIQAKHDEVYDIDPSNMQPESIFSLCLGVIIPNRIDKVELTHFERRDLLKLLMRCDLEEYEDFLIEYQHIWKDNDKRGNPQSAAKRKMNLLLYKIHLIELLMSIRVNQSKNPSNTKIDVTIKDGINNHKIHFDNYDFFLSMQKMLMYELNKLRLFDSYLPPNLVKDDIINSVDSVWNLKALSNYKKSEFNLEIEPPIICFKAIKDYAVKHPIKPNVIENEQLKSKYDSLKAELLELNKPGAHDKNSRKATLAIGLTYLYNFNNYWEQNEIKSIYDFPVTHDIYRFVYDYLNIWGLIEKKNITSDKMLKTNYAKALINNLKSKVDFEYNNKKFSKEYIIDMLHRIKHEEAEIAEYLNYIERPNN